jgi:hypothetical protein
MCSHDSLDGTARLKRTSGIARSVSLRAQRPFIAPICPEIRATPTPRPASWRGIRSTRGITAVPFRRSGGLVDAPGRLAGRPEGNSPVGSAYRRARPLPRLPDGRGGGAAGAVRPPPGPDRQATAAAPDPMLTFAGCNGRPPRSNCARSASSGCRRQAGWQTPTPVAGVKALPRSGCGKSLHFETTRAVSRLRDGDGLRPSWKCRFTRTFRVFYGLRPSRRVHARHGRTKAARRWRASQVRHPSADLGRSHDQPNRARTTRTPNRRRSTMTLAAFVAGGLVALRAVENDERNEQRPAGGSGNRDR